MMRKDIEANQQEGKEKEHAGQHVEKAANKLAPGNISSDQKKKRCHHS